MGAEVDKLTRCALAVLLSRGQAYRAGRFAAGQHQPGRTLAAGTQRQLCAGDAPPVLQPVNWNHHVHELVQPSSQSQE